MTPMNPPKARRKEANKAQVANHNRRDAAMRASDVKECWVFGWRAKKKPWYLTRIPSGKAEQNERIWKQHSLGTEGLAML